MVVVDHISWVDHILNQHREKIMWGEALSLL